MRYLEGQEHQQCLKSDTGLPIDALRVMKDDITSLIVAD